MYRIEHFCDDCEAKLEEFVYHFKIEGAIKRADKANPTLLYSYPVGGVSLEKALCEQCAEKVIHNISALENKKEDFINGGTGCNQQCGISSK